MVPKNYHCSRQLREREPETLPEHVVARAIELFLTIRSVQMLALLDDR